MKVDKKANFCIFFLIAILALGLSNIVAIYTGDFVSASFPSINDTEKMIALDNDNFYPESVNTVYEPKPIVEEVNETENETDTNSTIIDEDTDNGDYSNDDGNGNSNSDSNANTDNNEIPDNTNGNGGGDSSDSSGGGNTEPVEEEE